VSKRGEVDISDREDRKTKKALISATMLGQRIHHGISPTVKHISAIACVSAAGESLTPDIITSQDSGSVPEQLKKKGVVSGSNFVWKSNRKLNINAEIFLDCIRTVFLFLPNLVELQALDEFAEEI
jgi:RecJ-like exonuclease